MISKTLIGIEGFGAEFLTCWQSTLINKISPPALLSSNYVHIWGFRQAKQWFFHEEVRRTRDLSFALVLNILSIFFTYIRYLNVFAIFKNTVFTKVSPKQKSFLGKTFLGTTSHGPNSQSLTSPQSQDGRHVGCPHTWAARNQPKATGPKLLQTTFGADQKGNCSKGGLRPHSCGPVHPHVVRQKHAQSSTGVGHFGPFQQRRCLITLVMNNSRYTIWSAACYLEQKHVFCEAAIK